VRAKTAMMQYEQRRENFNKILEAYLDYVALFKLFNKGSIKGVTPFYIFYWRMTNKVMPGMEK
jgi:hypothetical protein